MSAVRRSFAVAITGLAAAAAIPGAALAATGDADLVAFSRYSQGVHAPGTEIALNLSLENHGEHADGVRFTAALPRGIEFRSGTTRTPGRVFDCSASTPRTLDCVLDDGLEHLDDPYDRPILTVTLGVTDAVHAGPAALTFSAQSSTADSDPSNNATTVTVPITTTFGTVSGRIWDDANRNGIQDRGEKGIAGKKINLMEMPGVDNSVVYQHTITDERGRYVFRHVPAHDYQVAVEMGELRLTIPNASANDQRDSDFDPLDAYIDTAFSPVFPLCRTATLDAGLVPQQ
jgi:hypothetical protein